MPCDRRTIACQIAVHLLLVTGAAAQVRPPLLTVAESSGFTATSRHADVLSFVRDLQRLSPKVRVETLCTSPEGRVVPMVVIGDPPPASPADMRFDDRAVVYLQANIHGGEVEGKDAMLMAVRDLIQGKVPNVLDRLVLLVVPVFNADGNDRISADNRTSQKGPAQGVGARANGQNLDLNRDGIKIESPEVAGLVDVLNRWDPVLFLDSHTHNGSYHQEPVTWVWGLNPNGDAAIIDYSAGTMWAAVERLMRDKYRTPVIPHGDFVDPRAPEKGWVPLEPLPRYLSNYVGLRGRLSVLNEQYPYVDFETRVRGCYHLLLSFLEFAHTNKDAIVRLARDADRRAIARGQAPGNAPGFVVQSEPVPVTQRLTIQGYEMEFAEGPGGRVRARPTERTRTYSGVPYLAAYRPTRTVRYPRGYLLPNPDPAVVAKLRQHGLQVERLVEPARVAVEAFRITSITPAAALNQGHYTNVVKGEYLEATKEFPAGTVLVSLAQRLGPLAASLLEPEGDDGLLLWNFFDRALSIQWGGGPREHVVYRLHDAVNLPREAVK